MAAKTTKTNMSVTKTIKLIEILAQSPEPMRLSDLAALAEIPASTTLRMVSMGTAIRYRNLMALSTGSKWAV